MSSGQSLLIVGGGAVATVMAGALSQSAQFDGQIAIWTRNGAQAIQAAGLCEGAQVAALGALADCPADVGTILICVSDDSIAEVAARLAHELPSCRGAVALHTSGYAGIDKLVALADAGLETGVLHPVIAIPKDGAVRSFESARFGVSGSTSAKLRIEELVRALGGSMVFVRDEYRGLYHGAAALLSGGVVALFAQAEACLAAALEPEAEADSYDGGQGAAREILLGLLQSTTQNLALKEPKDALTGPYARGDYDVVQGHSDAFQKADFARAHKLHALLTDVMGELVKQREQAEG